MSVDICCVNVIVVFEAVIQMFDLNRKKVDIVSCDIHQKEMFEHHKFAQDEFIFQSSSWNITKFICGRHFHFLKQHLIVCLLSVTYVNLRFTFAPSYCFSHIDIHYNFEFWTWFRKIYTVQFNFFKSQPKKLGFWEQLVKLHFTNLIYHNIETRFFAKSLIRRSP